MKEKETNFGVISLLPASCEEEHAIIRELKCKSVCLEKTNCLVFGLKKMELLKGVEEREFEKGEKVVIEMGLRGHRIVMMIMNGG